MYVQVVLPVDLSGEQVRQVLKCEVYDRLSFTITSPLMGAHLGDIEGPPPRRRIRLTMDTPARILHRKRLPEELTLRIFARSLLGRLSSLLEFHCGRELRLDFRGLLEEAEAAVTVQHDLEIQPLRRWSNRQKRSIGLEGFMGQVSWEGEAVRSLWPALLAGELVHVGKGTIFGLGRYTIQLP